MENIYIVAIVGTSLRFEPHTKQAFVREMRANGWNNISDFYFEHYGSNRYGLSFKVRSNNSISESENIIRSYFNYYFSIQQFSINRLNITPILTNTNSTTTYTVKSGDTLSKIAQRFGMTFANLVALNSSAYPSLLTNPNSISVGWVFRVSGSPNVPANNNPPNYNNVPANNNLPGQSPPPPQPNFLSSLGDPTTIAVFGVVLAVILISRRS